MISASLANSLGWKGGSGPSAIQRCAPFRSTPMPGTSTAISATIGAEHEERADRAQPAVVDAHQRQQQHDADRRPDAPGAHEVVGVVERQQAQAKLEL